MTAKSGQIVLKIYQRLFSTYGRQHWWPGETPFEIIVGAILTQSAAWTNVEKAIDNLKSASVLSPEAILNTPLEELAQLIRSSGYYNAKAKKLKAFVEWLDKNFRNDLQAFSEVNTEELRNQLLAVHGIGNETADSILLYALDRPVFVIDAYTIRIISRIGLLSEESSYTEYQRYFMSNLPVDVKLYNEYHALFVRLGKEACQKKPDCAECCLGDICRRRIA